MAGPVAIALGGSILAPSEYEPDFLQSVAACLTEAAASRPLRIAVGGGAPARRAIQAARRCGIPEEELDRIGIAATRLNAQMLASLLRAAGADANVDVPATIEEATLLGEDHRVVVMGGTTPGHSTDYVAAELAIASAAERLVVATNVDGVYERDPKADPAARRLERLDFKGLLDVVQDTSWRQAGAPGVVDGPATVLVARHGVTTCVVQGRDLPNLLAVMTGKAFTGTCIEGTKVTA